MEPKIIWLLVGTFCDGKSDVLGAYSEEEAARFEARKAVSKDGMMISLQTVELDLCL